MDLVLWIFLLINSYNFCSSLIITKDMDNSIFKEVMKDRAVEVPSVPLSNHQKRRICELILDCSHFRRLAWEYLDKSEALESFSRRFPHHIWDHYDENDTNECFVVKDQCIKLYNNEPDVTLPSFACLADDKSSDSSFKEIFVSYTRIKGTFVISIGKYRNRPWNGSIKYLGIAETSPGKHYQRLGPGVEEYFKYDRNLPGDTEERLNELSPSRQSRLCKLVINGKDENIEPERIDSVHVHKRVGVNLTDCILVIDAVLSCSVLGKDGYYHEYLALSKMNRSAVHVLKKLRDDSESIILELTGYYFQEIPTLNEGYDTPPNNEP